MNTNETSSITTSEWLHKATDILKKAGIGTARLDALILIEDITGKDRSHLLAHPDMLLLTEHVNDLSNKIAQRKQHTPLAYIREKTEFYGRSFIVNSHVLVPRPETEMMIDLLLRIRPAPKVIIDVGTGSGALAITAKLALPLSTVYATDIDRGCLAIAQKNIHKLSVEISLLYGDLLNAIPMDLFANNSVLLCNLPYVPENHTVNQAAMKEPHNAIFGGIDGLDVYRKLFRQLYDIKNRPKYILTEALPFQHPELELIALRNSYYVQEDYDFIQVFALSTPV